MTSTPALPAPSGDFHWTHEDWGPMLRCCALDAVAQHGFTTRQLALRPGETWGGGWVAAARSVGCGIERLQRVRQVHGAVVHVATVDTPPTLPDADAVIAATPGLAVAVVAADCVPILLADRTSGAVAAVHAGWRGTAADVAGAAVAALTREWGVAPERLVAAIGPSIGACCYTVGPELVTAFLHAGHPAEAVARWFTSTAGRLVLDLWHANRDLLVAAGLRPDCVHVAGLCTQSHATIFESFRADGDRAGRMAAIIVAPEHRGPGPESL